MEIASRFQERENPSPLNSPHSNGSSSTNTNSNSNGSVSVQIPTPPLTPKPIPSRSEPNPYPTTFVQADTATFKQVVQMLTGSSETVKQATKPNQQPDPPPSSKACIPPIKPSHNKKQGFKLYERRNSLKQGLMISPLIPTCLTNNNSSSCSSTSGFSPRSKPEILSPSILNFPSLVLSPVTPLLTEDPFNKSSPCVGGGNSSSEEERAIAEKKFYLHPSPMNTPRYSEPQLLPLFPVTSPRVSGSSSSSP